MNRVDELIRELCPGGVQFAKIGDLGDFQSGLRGKSKSDFESGNCPFVPYSNCLLYTSDAADE